MIISRRQALIGAACAVATSGMPALATELFIVQGPAFGTSWRLTLPSSSNTASAVTAIENIIFSVDTGMSPFRGDSEVSQFNKEATTDWMPLSAETGVVVKNALKIAEQSNGAFDPTIGPLVGRYGFGPITNAPVGNFTGIDVRSGGIRKNDIDLSLDLCGIAKGYALDRMTLELDALGIKDYLLELGGEVFARGRHPLGRQWQVGIERPASEPLQFQHLIGLEGRALATSGDTVNAYDFDGLRYSHIIDPRTSAPKRNSIASVSVLTTRGMKADALATTLMVMGPEFGADFAEKENIAALFIVRDGSGLREIMTGDFPEYILT